VAVAPHAAPRRICPHDVAAGALGIRVRGSCRHRCVDGAARARTYLLVAHGATCCGAVALRPARSRPVPPP
jgi:hypothetical protein